MSRTLGGGAQPNSPYRVTHVIAPVQAGGAESIVLSLAQLDRANVDVAALIQHDGVDPFSEDARGKGVHVREIRCGRRRYVAEIAALAEYAEERGSHILHTHVYHADVAGYFAARRAGLPVVATVHGFTGGDLRNRFYEGVDRWLLRRFDAVIAVSHDLRRRLIHSGVPPSRAFLVPNSLAPFSPLSRQEARHRLGLPDGAIVIGWVGRLSREKGADLLLEAVHGLGIPGVVTVIVGDGPERPALERGVAGRGENGGGEVRLVGHVPGAASLFRAFDVLVMSSRTEGHPVVLLEAVAAGTPIVAFAVGGVSEFVTETTAWLAPPGDVVRLRATIQHALGDREEASRRASRAQRTLGPHFGHQRWLEQLLAVYERVTRA